jgi:hypothetical protein
MHSITHPTPLSQAEICFPTFIPGVHSYAASASIVPQLPQAVKLLQDLKEKNVIRRLTRASAAGSGALPVSVVGGAPVPLVSSSKSHPNTPPWLGVPSEPSWCYQVFRKDVFVCRHFPAMPPRENPPNPRASIYEFSDKSRAHLDHIACNSGHLVKSQFCLTYRNQMPMDGEACKAHLDKWLKAYRRRNPGGHYLWVLEFQKRGVPHFHVFLSIPVNRELQKKMARSWVRITEGDDVQYWWHCRSQNWIAWNMADGKYMMKNYCVKIAQKEVPANFRNVGRFWGCSRSMTPIPTHYGPQEIAKLTVSNPSPWHPASIRHYFDKILRRYQEKQMNYDRQGNRRENPATGKVNSYKKASIIRHESELSGNFKIKNGAKVVEQLLNYVVTHGPDRWSLRAALQHHVPF